MVLICLGMENNDVEKLRSFLFGMAIIGMPPQIFWPISTNSQRQNTVNSYM